MIKRDTKYIYFIILAVLCTSCKKEEADRTAPEILTSISTEPVYQTVAHMTADYQEQVYISLSEATEVASHLKTDWDLSFDTSSDAWEIRLNSSRLMKVWKSPYEDIAALVSVEGMEDNGKFDTPDGSLEGNAFGDWTKDKFIYLLDMGVNNIDGSSYGYQKCRMISVNSSYYEIDIAPIASLEWTRVKVLKKQAQSEVLFSFEDQTIIERPSSESYDLFFTQYTHIFDEPEGPLPYLVSGALIKSKDTEVAKVNDKSFDALNGNDIDNYVFSNELDLIGYDWKSYDIELGVFTIFPEMNYLIRNKKGEVYKLHFIDFYDNQGVKGAPKMEYQLIQK